MLSFQRVKSSMAHALAASRHGAGGTSALNILGMIVVDLFPIVSCAAPVHREWQMRENW